MGGNGRILLRDFTEKDYEDFPDLLPEDEADYKIAYAEVGDDWSEDLSVVDGTVVILDNGKATEVLGIEASFVSEEPDVVSQIVVPVTVKQLQLLGFRSSEDLGEFEDEDEFEDYEDDFEEDS